MPERPPLPFDYLVVEGNIGAGKTTLCELLARDHSCRLVLEEFAENPFLPLFYEDRERYAFAVELSFMMERRRQLAPLLLAPQLFAQPILADYLFAKTWLFASHTLRGDELSLFKKLFEELGTQLPLPRKLLFLQRPVEVLLEQIAQRGRSFEADIEPDYLTAVERTYLTYLRTETRFPVLLLNLGRRDFTEDSTVYSAIVEQLNADHPDGLTTVDLDRAD